MNFREIENSAYGEINERSFSNPHPWTDSDKLATGPPGTNFVESLIKMTIVPNIYMTVSTV